MYSSQDLVEALRQRPFRPLQMELSSGEQIEITHPEQAIVTSTDGVILLKPSDKPGVHHWRLVGLDHILGLSRMHAHEVNGD